MTNSSRRQRKLYKDPNDKKIAGVASGVAKYFDIDTTLVRAVWVVLALGGVGILLYVVLWIMLEDEPADLDGPFGDADADAGVDAGEPTGNNEAIAVESDEAEEPKPGPGDVNGG
ncbi:MAG: PspC domain-containing protein [bacterium]|nr:PspC domain-containing protein [bacterium]